MNRLVAAELHKLVTTRLWLWLLLAAMGLTALYAGLNIAFTDDPDNFAPHLSTPEGQRLHYATAASAVATLAAVLGAIGVTSEFRYRTATATFLATPRRGRVLAAKIVTYPVVGVGYAAACLLVTVALGVPWLATRDITLTVSGNGVPATFAGVLATGALFAVVGVGVGALVRDQVAATVGLLVYLLVAEPIVTAVPAMHGWTSYLPGPAASALAGSTLETREFLPAWHGGLMLLAYATALALAGAVVAGRRDIT